MAKPIKNKNNNDDLTDQTVRTEVTVQRRAIEPLMFSDTELTALFSEDETSLLNGNGLNGSKRIKGKVISSERCE